MRFQRSVVNGCWVTLAGLLLVMGCAKSRFGHRGHVFTGEPFAAGPIGASRQVPGPVWPTVQRVRTTAAYAPYEPIVPRGSWGFSRDIRYPRQQGSGLGGPERLELHEVSPIPIAPVAPQRAPRTQRRPTPIAPESSPGIPGWHMVESDLATGGQPTLESLVWLRDRGFSTVLNLLPEEDELADPAESGFVSRQFGMRYLSLAVTPERIDDQLVAEFKRIVDERRYRPLFIHDSDGSRVGAMWYLRRILVDRHSHQSALDEARRIGLKDTDTELWLAIRSYLTGKGLP